MLMDLFYSTLPPHIARKRRVHFHAFMVDVHKRLHSAKLAMGYKGGDPILPVARDLAKEAYVLCFDEFQVCSCVLCSFYCSSHYKILRLQILPTL
jgi:peroxisome-assembly ATPase